MTSENQIAGDGPNNSVGCECSAKFGTIYKDFEKELSGINDRILALIQKYVANYEKMTDTKADELAMKLLEIEQNRSTLKKKYYVQVKNGLNAITATRFLQVEN